MNGFNLNESCRFNHDTLEIIVQKRTASKLADYNQQKNKIKEALNAHLNSLKASDAKIYVWGASHQAFTLLSTLSLNAAIEGVIDSADFKWGKFTPSSHLPYFLV